MSIWRKRMWTNCCSLFLLIFFPEGNFVFVCLPRGRFLLLALYIICIAVCPTEVGYWSSHIDPTRTRLQVAIQQPTAANFPQISLLLLRWEKENSNFPSHRIQWWIRSPGLFVPPKMFMQAFRRKRRKHRFLSRMNICINNCLLSFNRWVVGEACWHGEDSQWCKQQTRMMTNSATHAQEFSSSKCSTEISLKEMD